MLAAGATLACPAAAPAQPRPGENREFADVRDYGAVGDGNSDATEAFRKALAAAATLATGRTVRVPPGTYRMSGSLTVESTLLLGLEAGGWPADSRPLPTLIVDVPAPQPCIVAKTGASLHGLCLDFDYKGNPKREFGPAVKLQGGGVSLTNLLFHNPTFGVVADGSANCGRVNLENIFIVNAQKIGVQFEYGMDVVTMRNVEVWNYLRELVGRSTGFRIGHVDEIRLSNCAVVQAAVGFHFVETRLPPAGQPGRVWGGMENCTVDSSGVGVKVDTASVLRIVGGSFWAHHFGVVVDGAGDVLLSGADVRANSNQCIHVKGGDSLTVNGCLLKKGKGWEQEAKVLVEGGKSLVLTGCTFDENSVGVRLSPKARRVVLAGNSFAEMPHKALIDETPPNARKVIANNLAS